MFYVFHAFVKRFTSVALVHRNTVHYRCTEISKIPNLQICKLCFIFCGYFHSSLNSLSPTGPISPEYRTGNTSDECREINTYWRRFTTVIYYDFFRPFRRQRSRGETPSDGVSNTQLTCFFHVG